MKILLKEHMTEATYRRKGLFGLIVAGEKSLSWLFFYLGDKLTTRTESSYSNLRVKKTE